MHLVSQESTSLRRSSMTLAQVESKEARDRRRLARASAPPLLHKAYTLCGEVITCALIFKCDSFIFRFIFIFSFE